MVNISMFNSSQTALGSILSADELARVALIVITVYHACKSFIVVLLTYILT